LLVAKLKNQLYYKKKVMCS